MDHFFGRAHLFALQTAKKPDRVQRKHPAKDRAIFIAARAFRHPISEINDTDDSSVSRKLGA